LISFALKCHFETSKTKRIKNNTVVAYIHTHIDIHPTIAIGKMFHVIYYIQEKSQVNMYVVKRESIMDKMCAARLNVIEFVHDGILHVLFSTFSTVSSYHSFGGI
jgi:hypothetical protein